MLEPLTILVTGSRGWLDAAFIESTLIQEIREYFKNNYDSVPSFSEVEEFVTIRHGGALGVDTMAQNFAEQYGIKTDVHLPEYDKYSRRIAPLRRNSLMVALGADICLAFRLNNSRGTNYTIDQARQANIPLKIFDAFTAPDGTHVRMGEHK